MTELHEYQVVHPESDMCLFARNEGIITRHGIGHAQNRPGSLLCSRSVSLSTNF